MKETVEFDAALEELEMETIDENIEEDLGAVVNVLLKGIDERMGKMRERLMDEGEDVDPERVENALEYHRAVMLAQAVLKGSITYLKARDIKLDVLLSVCASDPKRLSKQGNPSLIGNFVFMWPESEEELDYHMNVAQTFLSAKNHGWGPGIYTVKDLKELQNKIEKEDEEYEEFVVRGKL